MYMNMFQHRPNGTNKHMYKYINIYSPPPKNKHRNRPTRSKRDHHNTAVSLFESTRLFPKRIWHCWHHWSLRFIALFFSTLGKSSRTKHSVLMHRKKFWSGTHPVALLARLWGWVGSKSSICKASPNRLAKCGAWCAKYWAMLCNKTRSSCWAARRSRI